MLKTNQTIADIEELLAALRTELVPELDEENYCPCGEWVGEGEDPRTEISDLVNTGFAQALRSLTIVASTGSEVEANKASATLLNFILQAQANEE